MRPSVWRAVFIVLLVGGIAAAATNNYQEAFYFVPSQSVAVSEFLSSHGNSVLALDGIFPQPVRLLTHAATPWDDVPFYTVYPVPLISYNRTTPALAVFDKTAMLWYVQGHGIEIYQYYEAQQAQFSQVYDNGYAQVYLLNGAVPGR